jgi:hypothetical protein
LLCECCYPVPTIIRKIDPINGTIHNTNKIRKLKIEKSKIPWQKRPAATSIILPPQVVPPPFEFGLPIDVFIYPEKYSFEDICGLAAFQNTRATYMGRPEQSQTD